MSRGSKKLSSLNFGSFTFRGAGLSVPSSAKALAFDRLAVGLSGTDVLRCPYTKCNVRICRRMVRRQGASIRPNGMKSIKMRRINEGPMDSAALFALQMRQNYPYRTPDPPSAFST